MTLRVAQSGRDDAFCPALEIGLARSGIAMSNDPSQPADSTLTCRIYASQDDGFLRITSNGETRMHFTVRVEVRSAQNVLVDQFIAEYNGFKSGGADEEAVNKVVLAFAYSSRIAAFARVAKNASPVVVATRTAVAPPPPPMPTAQANDPRDDSTWFGIDTVRCKVPARVEACDAVRMYLRRWPNGAHAGEANDLLTAAQPALEQLQKEEVIWQKANRNDCIRQRSSRACVGVEAYEMQFPGGMHAEEAHRLLKAAGVDK